MGQALLRVWNRGWAVFVLAAVWCERSVVFVGNPQEVALVVSKATKSHEVCSVYLARIVGLAGKLMWPWADCYLLKS